MLKTSSLWVRHKSRIQMLTIGSARAVLRQPENSAPNAERKSPRITNGSARAVLKTQENSAPNAEILNPQATSGSARAVPRTQANSARSAVLLAHKQQQNT